ncbi:MAG: substrate-binding domain-containing protein [Kiritimatiellae bacterium]|nr:substrate-binding domain-containing protein [Kiritimatiellia bacterium]
MQPSSSNVPAGGAAAKVPVVALLFTPGLKGSRTTYRGILDWAAAHGPWRLVFPEGRPGEQALDLSAMGVDAVVAHQLSRRRARQIAALGVPVVLAEPLPEMREEKAPLASCPCVRMDSRAVGAMAARYFLGRGYRSFAYVGEPCGMYWSAERRAGFVEALAKAGHSAAVFDGPWPARAKRSWTAERPSMIRFLRSLPRPAAVFAAMDGRAMLVLDACIRAGLSVPEEIAVLGVDDDPIICNACVPALSSIRTGGYRRGLHLAAMLDDLMHGRPVPRDAVVEEPLSVETRGSTGYDAMSDPVLGKAVAFIRAHGASGRCDVGAVAAAAGCSRRYAEKKFREKLGVSVRRFVLSAKIERAKRLLEKETMPIGEIPAAVGVRCNCHLSVLFKKETGFSMRDWRRLHRDAPVE